MPVLTRREYREEYLQSDEWKDLRAKVLSRGRLCEKCHSRPMHDVHHLRYKKIFNVTPKNLIGLCRSCHELVEDAKRAGLIPKEHSRGFVLGITREQVDARVNRKNSRVQFTESLLQRLQSASILKQRLACGVMKMPHPGQFSEWSGARTTQSKIDRIWRILQIDHKPKQKRLHTKPKPRVKIHY